MSEHFRTWYVVSIEADRKIRDVLSGFCFDLGASGVEETDSELKAYFGNLEDIGRIKSAVADYFTSLIELGETEKPPVLSIGEVSEENWAENWKDHFKPLEAGRRLLIVPPWHAGMQSGDRITIVIEPGMAFGTGNHESTALVLGLLEKYIHDGDSVWDAGTGSGILAIAAVKLGAGKVYAVDIEKESVEAAAANAGINDVSSNMRVEFKSVGDCKKTEYNCITANLSRNLLLDYAQLFSVSLMRGGFIICSGIEKTDMKTVCDNFGKYGLVIADSAEINIWTGIVFKKT